MKITINPILSGGGSKWPAPPATDSFETQKSQQQIQKHENKTTPYQKPYLLIKLFWSLEIVKKTQKAQLEYQKHFWYKSFPFIP